MSRARPIEVDGRTIWFDTSANHKRATVTQLELLAAVEDISIDDLLDEGLSQGQLLFRLREKIHGNLIPAEVMERRRLRRIEAARQPECRICSPAGLECEGQITRHHFIPRWLMRELENYTAYAARVKCTIPICVGRHRDLHYRDGEQGGKSIVDCLTADEKAFGAKLLGELQEQHPKIFELLASGDETTYEGTLIRDFLAGRFHQKY